MIRGGWLILAVVALLGGSPDAEAVDLNYYLPAGTDYDADVPTPASYLGFEIGERHILHHELVGYMQALAEVSNRVTIREYARSYGDRPLVLLTITSPHNHARIDELRDLHHRLADPALADDVDFAELPAVINMGYSVHGNEPSAGNVSPVVAYHLAAARGPEIESLLEEVVVLLDPCLNPDGFERFAHWANNHRGRTLNADNQHREHQEGWPSGRTNYYWFDLNRDWLAAQHPESRGRLEIARAWRPNVVLDFHEMGGNATFFFQPGVPTRTNPLTPAANITLTSRIGDFHAQALDGIRSLYYTQERYDDFYMGKGSTYPDLHGGVGILFEQASSRGHVADTDNGRLTFPFTIRNQFKTSLSSLAAVQTLRTDLLDYKRTFYQDALALARGSKAAGYVVAAPGDPVRLREFLTILDRHGIAFAPLAENVTADGCEYLKDRDWFIPTVQAEYRFLADLFARRTTFEENIFYDISAWTLPLAFNLRHAEVSTPPATSSPEDPLGVGDRVEAPRFSNQDVAYVIDWRGRYAPRTLSRLHEADIRVKVAQRPFGVDDRGQTIDCPPGTLLVPLSMQEDKIDAIRDVLSRAAEDGTQVTPVRTSLTQGIDLGSSYFALLEKPRVLLVVGPGADSYEAGEAWHLLDHVYRMTTTLVDTNRLGSIPWREYNTAILVSGSYDALGSGAVASLKQWVAEGGTLIALGTAINWLNKADVAKIATRPDADDAAASKSDVVPRRLPYASAADNAAFRLIKGAIFETELDLTHPIAYGYVDQTLPVFRDNVVMLEPARNPYATPVLYAEHPLLSGYVSSENLARLGRSASVVIHKSGSGRIVAMADNPNFRAFWHGTNRLFLNALLFGSIIGVPAD